MDEFHDLMGDEVSIRTNNGEVSVRFQVDSSMYWTHDYDPATARLIAAALIEAADKAEAKR